jgi:hypothetical protein
MQQKLAVSAYNLQNEHLAKNQGFLYNRENQCPSYFDLRFAWRSLNALAWTIAARTVQSR